MVERTWRAKYTSVFDACPSAAFVAGGAPLSLHYANAAFERLFGPASDNARLGEVLPKPIADAVTEIVASVRASGAPASRAIFAAGAAKARFAAWPLGSDDADEIAVELALESFEREPGGGVERFGLLEGLEKVDRAAYRISESASPGSQLVRINERLVVTTLRARQDAEDAKGAGDRALALLEGAPEAMLLFDRKGTLQLANAEAGRMFRMPPRAMVGLPWEALGASPPWLRLVGDGEPGEGGPGATRPLFLEGSARRLGGAPIPVEIRVSRVAGASERVYAVCLRDATERLRAEAEQRARIDAERLARAEAERAQRRLALLTTAGELLSTSFEARRALTTLGDVVVPEHAVACAFRLLPDRRDEDPGPGEADIVAPETRRDTCEALLDRLEASTLAASEPVVLSLEACPRARRTSSTVVAAPLRVRERVVGMTLFLFDDAAGREEGTLVEELAQRAAVAVDQERLYREAWRAHEEATSFASAVSRLQEVTAALSEALEPAEVAAVLADLGARAAGASAIRLYAPRGDADAIELLAAGPSAPRPPSPAGIAAPAATLEEIRGALGGRSPRWLTRKGPGERARPVAIGLAQLAAGGRVLGVLEVVLEGRPARRADLSFVEALAREGAQALHRARLYEAVTQARRMAEEASCLKDEFLGVVSHELRTPLTAILGWARLIRAKAGDTALLARGLTVIEQNVEAQTRIVSDLLDVSRIVAGKLSFEPAPVDLGAIAQGAFDGVRHAAEAAGIELLLACDSPAPFVSGDAGRLHQVLWNLLSNAIKFTPRGGRVALVVARAGGAARVDVEDDGAGIDPAFLPFVFDRFRQADSSITRRQGGLGLGLAIAKSIVQLHGGTIEAESAGPGRGSTFRIELPLAPDLALPLSPEEDAEPPREARLDGIRVLVVEDEKDTRELVLAVLELAGASVREATSAAAGLAALESFRPDVLVSDIAMPGEDGLSFLRRVRAQDGPAGRVPAIALTAYARPDAGRRLLQAGFQLYLPKPVQPELLALAVLRLTQASRPILQGEKGERDERGEEPAQVEAGERASRKGA